MSFVHREILNNPKLTRPENASWERGERETEASVAPGELAPPARRHPAADDRPVETRKRNGNEGF